LKASVVKQAALKQSIPALRAQIADLDYAIVMGEVAAKKKVSAPKAVAANAAPAPGTVKVRLKESLRHSRGPTLSLGSSFGSPKKTMYEFAQ
jgi:hypothetical protein